MPAPREGDLPRYVINFAVAVEALERVPGDVDAVAGRIRDAWSRPRPKTALSRSLAALRAQRPEVFESVRTWLERQEAVMAFSGMSDTRKVWLRACEALSKGDRVSSVLFGGRSGRPWNSGFSAADD